MKKQAPRAMALVCAGLAVSSALTAAVIQAQRVSFEDAQSFEAGNYPSSVAVGDFNGDGALDLAVANTCFGCDFVSVFMGKGDGSFQAARIFGGGTGPLFVAVGDFNGDGVPDLATANLFSNNVSVLLGNGDGSFQAARSFGVGNAPYFVAVGDFNGDGVPDLATANLNSNDVSVLLGSGGGSFQVARSFSVGGRPSSI